MFLPLRHLIEYVANTITTERISRWRRERLPAARRKVPTRGDSSVISVLRLGGLHHRYDLAA